MRRLPPLAALAFVALSMVAAGPPAIKTDHVVAKDEIVRVFYCTHSAGFRHPVLPETREILKGLGSSHAWLDVTVSDDITDLTPERIEKTDVVMFYTTGALPMGPMKRRLIEWVAGGGALVGVHSATDTFKQDPEFARTIGGVFDGHPWHEQVTIRIDDPKHASAAPFLESSKTDKDGRVTFEITDEIYQFQSLQDDMHVILSLDDSNRDLEAGRSYPLAWTLEIGKGRVFYTALGHRSEVWNDPRFIGHVLEGVRWAAGDEEAK